MQQVKGFFFLIGAFMLAGTAVIAARYVTGKIGPYTITCISLFFAVLFLFPFMKRNSLQHISQLKNQDWLHLLFQAVFGVFLYRMFLLSGLLYTSCAEAGILIGTTPAITITLSKILFKEKLSVLKALGILGTLVGIFLIQNLFTNAIHFSTSHILGNISILCAATCESLFNACSKIMANQNQSKTNTLSPMEQTVLVSLIAIALCLLPASFENPLSMLAQSTSNEWLSLIWYGIFVTALAYIFWYAGIQRCSLSTAAAFSGMVPCTAMLLSVFILKEIPTTEQWIGCLFLIASMTLIGFDKKDFPLAAAAR